MDDTGSAATSYTGDTVEAETAYVYAVQARNGAGDGDRSDTAEVLTPAAPKTDAEPLIAKQQLESIALVSNTKQKAAPVEGISYGLSGLGLLPDAIAVEFTTGSNPEGYRLSEVQVLASDGSSGSALVEASIFTSDSGNPGTSVHVLDTTVFATDMPRRASLTAPDGATLEARGPISWW